MIKLDLPGYSVEKRNAIDGSKQHLPIVFAVVGVGVNSHGQVMVTLCAWVDEDGKLTVHPTPTIVRTPDA